MTGTHQSFPVRNAQTKQRPFPRRGFCCPVGSSGTTAASDAHPAPTHFPVLPVIGRDAPTTSTQAAGPGRASPVPAATLRAFRAPYAGKSLGAAIQALHPFRGLRPDNPGSALPLPRPRPDGSRHGRLRLTLRTARSLPPKGLSTLGFDAGRFPPTPPACYRASWQLPGPDSHRQATTSLCWIRSPQTTTPNSGHTPLSHGSDRLVSSAAHARV